MASLHLFIKSLTQIFINKLLCGSYTGNKYLKNFKELKTWDYYSGDKDNQERISKKFLYIAKMGIILFSFAAVTNSPQISLASNSKYFSLTFYVCCTSDMYILSCSIAQAEKAVLFGIRHLHGRGKREKELA